MPYFLNRRVAGRRVIGVFNEPPYTSTITWEVEGDVTSFRISYGTWRSTELSGTHEITSPGSYSFSYVAVFSGRGSVRILKDGTAVVDKNNYRTERREVDTGQPCREYTISSARDNCRPGYTKRSRDWYTATATGWGSGVYRFVNGERVDTRVRYDRQGHGATAAIARENARAALRRVNGLATLSSNVPVTRSTQYYCAPGPNCRHTRTETVQTHSAIPISGGFTVTTIRQPAPQPQQPERPTQPQPQQPETQVIVTPPVVTGGTPRQTVTYTEAKYRVISPARFIQDGNQVIPELRYESVRELTAPEVSDLIGRGFKVESVPQDTPLVESRPYGPSVVAVGQAKHPGANQPLITIRGPRVRRGIAAVAPRTAPRAQRSTTSWRAESRNRRVVS